MIHFVAAWLFEHGVICVQRGADREAFIASRWLDVSPSKWRFSEELPIRHAVERASARHSQIVRSNFVMQPVQQMEENFFKAMLQGKREVHVTLANFRVGLPRLPK